MKIVKLVILKNLALPVKFLMKIKSNKSLENNLKYVNVQVYSYLIYIILISYHIYFNFLIK